MSRFGLFHYRGIDFAIPLEKLRRILHDQRVFLLPRLPEAVFGVLVDNGRLFPVLDLFLVTAGERGTTRSEYMVLLESEYGVLAIPADQTCGVVSEPKGTAVPADEGAASWLIGHFLLLDKRFQILDIDILASLLARDSSLLKSDTGGARRHQ